MLSWWRPTSAPSWSKIMHRVLVVPWSMAAVNSANSCSSPTAIPIDHDGLHGSFDHRH